MENDTSVDPRRVPQRTLFTGATIPAIGLGTFGSDRFSGETIAAAVKDAIRVGYRQIDCASVYGNEHLIGQALCEAMADGVKREALWITSKVWNDMHDRAIESCEKSLRDLQLDYLDLYLIHWPFPNFHAPGVDVNSRDPHAKPYIHENYMKTWRQLEQLVKRGLVRHIGTSNMTIPKLNLLLATPKSSPPAPKSNCTRISSNPNCFSTSSITGLCRLAIRRLAVRRARIVTKRRTIRSILKTR